MELASDHFDPPLSGVRVVDLSQPLSSEMSRWPGTEPLTAQTIARIEADGFYERRLSLPEHVGTHIDAPAHFHVDGPFVDRMPLEVIFAPGQMIDASDVCDGDADYALDARTLERLEQEQGVQLMAGHIALFRFGWDEHLADQSRYAGDLTETPAFPGLSPSAGELLVQRGCVAVGIDTLGVEPGAATDYPLHRITLGAGLFHIEGLVGLSALPPDGFHLLTAPLPLRHGSGSPARVLALVGR